MNTLPENIFSVTINEDVYELNTTDIDQLDVQSADANSFHLLKNNKSYHISIEEANYRDKSFTLNVNGTKYVVDVADHFDRLVNQLGLSIVSSQKVNDIKAPMPGLVLDIPAKTGQEVKKGDALLILEAMKMENIIKSAGDGIVKSILVKKGTAVDKGELLIEME